MSEAARSLDDILEDFHAAARKIDPSGDDGWDLLQEVRQNGADGLDEPYQSYFRLLKFQRFLEREDHRIRANPEQLRPIAMAEALDSLVRPAVQQQLQGKPPKQSWLELLCPYPSAPDAARLRTLKGHTRGVSSLCWAGNNRWIVSGSGDQTVKVWDAITGECLTLQRLFWKADRVGIGREPHDR